MDWFLYDNGRRHERVNTQTGFLYNCLAFFILYMSVCVTFWVIFYFIILQQLTYTLRKILDNLEIYV